MRSVGLFNAKNQTRLHEIQLTVVGCMRSMTCGTNSRVYTRLGGPSPVTRRGRYDQAYGSQVRVCVHSNPRTIGSAERDCTNLNDCVLAPWTLKCCRGKARDINKACSYLRINFGHAQRRQGSSAESIVGIVQAPPRH